MHPEAYDFVRANCRPWRVCEFGSYDVNGSVRDLFQGWDFVGVDVRSGPGVDVVADCTDWLELADALRLIDGDGQIFQGSSRRFDLVVCTESLEHVKNWHQLIVNAYRILRPNGRFICTAAGPEREPHTCDGNAMEEDCVEHYQNIHPETLQIALRTAYFSRVNVVTGRNGEDVYASAWK